MTICDFYLRWPRQGKHYYQKRHSRYYIEHELVFAPIFGAPRESRTCNLLIKSLSLALFSIGGEAILLFRTYRYFEAKHLTVAPWSENHSYQILANYHFNLVYCIPLFFTTKWVIVASLSIEIKDNLVAIARGSFKTPLLCLPRRPEAGIEAAMKVRRDCQ